MAKRKKSRKRTRKPDPLSLGVLRKPTAHLPDSTLLLPTWKDGPPGDHEPGITLFGFTLSGYDGEPVVSDTDGAQCVGVEVGLFYLDEDG